MTTEMIKRAALAVVLAAASGASGYWLSQHRAKSDIPSHAVSSSGLTTNDSRKVLYWYDPMSPTQHFDKPGKSPFMNMDLVPKYADGVGADNSVRIDPLLTQNTGIKFATVERGSLNTGIDAAGSLLFNDRQVAVVQARTGGIVERVYARATNDVISAGAPLADVRVPEWYGAQAEYLALRKAGDAGLAAAARTRLRQLGMSEAQIARTEMSGEPQAMVTISLPLSGVLQEIGVREGMTVMPGQTLARINGISSLWLEAEVPEAQAAGLALGATISATFTAWPAHEFHGRIVALLPVLDREARTVRVRVELPNPDATLRPGMYAQVHINETTSSGTLWIPSEAVIATGKRSLVIIAEGDGHFRPAEVKTGREAEGKTQILDGLKEGERIVDSGQFLIDSEASLEGVLARMDSPPQANARSIYQAQGTVEAISTNEVTISHGPVPTLGWGAMTMPFKLANRMLVQGINVGDTVNFAFHESDGGMVVERMQRMGGDR